MRCCGSWAARSVESLDHVDGNGLNNQRSNLRVCTHTENARNRRLNKRATPSGLKGVYRRATGGWQARIRTAGKFLHLGDFDSKLEAAMAHDRAAGGMMRIGSLFSGIGGLELGLEWAGLGTTEWQVEIDPFCRRVLERHWPQARRFEDVTTFAGEPADLICGGFPCQDLSVAGKQKGIDDGERSGLWREFGRVVGAVRPGWVVVENVGHTWRKWVPRVRGDLHRLGYASVPLRVRASDVGAWHERSRIFVVADALGVILREQQGWGGGACWRGALESAIARAKGADPDPNPPRSHEGIRGVAGARGRPQPQHGDRWWASEPDVARVVHGLSGRVDRAAALGNSVVPQAAMAVGHFIRDLVN